MAELTATAGLELRPRLIELRAARPRVIEVAIKEILAGCAGCGRRRGEGCEDGLR